MKHQAKKSKAIVLFSGGLDSILAAKLVLEQNIELHALTFITPFSGFAKLGRSIPARVFAQELGIPLTVMFLGTEFVELVQHPSHGYGKNMNPCIDCRIMLLRKAKEFMQHLGADFIITGEVVGERPMTQNKKSLKLVEEQSGLKGLLVRPLSANLLKPTLAEQQGLIERRKLMDIAGRSRKPQMALARNFDIKDYPTPAGGCLLTDPAFSRKLDDALRHGESTLRDIAMLKFGRHFRLLSGAKLIVGRNEQENSRILASQTENSLCFDVRNIASPIALIRQKKDGADIEQAAAICLRYSDCESDEGTVEYWKFKDRKQTIKTAKIREPALELLRIS